MRILCLVFVLLAGSWSSRAMAQETGVVGELERTAASTPQEKLRYAAEANTEIREALKQITRMIDTAKREATPEQMQCLQARLSAVRALASVSEAAETAMTEALEAGEAERAAHEFRKVAVARVKARELLSEAERCIDDSPTRSGETDVVVEGSPPGDESDTAGVDEDPFDIGFDPPQASPFM